MDGEMDDVEAFERVVKSVISSRKFRVVLGLVVVLGFIALTVALAQGRKTISYSTLHPPEGIYAFADGENKDKDAGCHCVFTMPAPTKRPKPTEAVGRIEVKLESNGDIEVTWDWQGAEEVEIRVNAPDGDLFGYSPAKSWIAPASWCKPGTWFYLQDVTKGKPLVKANTIAAVGVR